MLVSIQQAAQLLGISRKTIERALQQGFIVDHQDHSQPIRLPALPLLDADEYFLINLPEAQRLLNISDERMEACIANGIIRRIHVPSEESVETEDAPPSAFTSGPRGILVDLEEVRRYFMAKRTLTRKPPPTEAQMIHDLLDTIDALRGELLRQQRPTPLPPVTIPAPTIVRQRAAPIFEGVKAEVPATRSRREQFDFPSPKGRRRSTTNAFSEYYADPDGFWRDKGTGNLTEAQVARICTDHCVDPPSQFIDYARKFWAKKMPNEVKQSQEGVIRWVSVTHPERFAVCGKTTCPFSACQQVIRTQEEQSVAAGTPET